MELQMERTTEQQEVGYKAYLAHKEECAVCDLPPMEFSDFYRMWCLEEGFYNDL